MQYNVARSFVGAHGEGNKQHADFVAHRLQSTAVAFHAQIKMNKIYLPGNRHKYRNKSKHVNRTKEDMHLLTHIYMMTMHVRERNSDRLFEVENADCPPSLSKHGVLRSDKSRTCYPAWKYNVHQTLMKMTPDSLMVPIWCIF